MSNIIYDSILRHAPADRKYTPGGWTSFNGPCCLNNGQPRPDTRKRAGVRIISDGTCVYNCFNCSYSAGWTPGRSLNNRMKTILRWFNMTDEELKKINFKIWQMQEMQKSEDPPVIWTKLDFKARELPSGARPIQDWIADGESRKDFITVIEYLASRGDDILTAKQYYWSPNRENSMNTRIIIPFYWDDKIVGWTARSAVPSKWRYFMDYQTNYIFNSEVTRLGWKYLFITEGPFDAIAINGVAMLGNHLTPEQISWINQTGLKPIVVPDREKEGGAIVDIAIKEGWSVSFPRWDRGIKDAADAVKTYGKLYTVWSIIDAQTDNRLQINIERKRLK